MDSRTRLLETLNHKQPDRIPLDLGAGLCCRMHSAFYRRLLEHFGLTEEICLSSRTAQVALASDAVLERLQCDVRTPSAVFRKKAETSPREWEDGAYFYLRDSWGTGYRMPKSVPLYYDMYEFPLADTPEAIASYAWPEPDEIDPAGVLQSKAYHSAGYPVAFTDHYANGFLQTAPRLFGYEGWLTMLGAGDAEVGVYLEQLLEMKMRHYDQVFARYGDAVDIFCESDDLGVQTGPFISPEMFRGVFKPYWRRLFAHIRANSGAKILLHSCGSCEAVIGDLIDVGLDILNPVQISAADMEPTGLKRKFGKDLVFWGGGVDTQKVLPHGSPEEVRDNVKRNIDALAKGGGFVFATVHNVQSDVPVRNFLAMWEAFIENRNY